MAEPVTAATELAFSFDTFRLLPSRRLLLDGETPVRLGSRAFEILITIVERHGELINKDELVARVWPGIHVAEGNLKFQVSGLRRALGDGRDGRRYIETSPGQGYRFVAAVRVRDDVGSARQTPTLTKHNLPVRLTRLIGRAGVISKLVEQLSTLRLLTIVGAGGIGKTAVAVALATELIPAYEHGVWLIDLAPVADPRLVPTASVSALSLEIRSDNSLPGLIAALSDKKMLIVLDNCEHVIAAAAELAVGILRGAPDVRILATSREPLQVQGEHVHSLLPLTVPSISDDLTSAEALRFPAVDLFVERAAARLDEFELKDADALIVANICRRLDGIPLAIEFAAGRIDAFGVRGLSAHLNDSLRLLSGGYRPALPRHQTMGAALDWSYNLLNDAERTMLRRLAIFVGGFTFAGARAIGADPTFPEDETFDLVMELTTKSLIATDLSEPEPRFRLLETTRAYAREKLAESGELRSVAWRHCKYYQTLFEQLEIESIEQSRDEWLANYAREIDDLRAALDWAFSSSGDVSIGVALTANSIPMWANLSFLEECRTHVERALARNDESLEGRDKMRLYSALALSQLLTQNSVQESEANLGKSLALAEALKDADYQVRALWGLYTHCFFTTKFGKSLEIAQKICRVADTAGDPVDRLIGDQLLGMAAHLLGDQNLARRHLERKPTHSARVDNRSDIVRFLYDSRQLGPMILMVVLWLQGLPDQALDVSQSAVKMARASNHPLTLCDMLTEVAWLSLHGGDYAIAEPIIQELTEVAVRFGFVRWVSYGRGLKGMLLVKTGYVDAGLPMLRTALGEVESDFPWRYPAYLGELAQALGQIGRVGEGIASVDDALQRCDQTEERWCMPELLRVKGDLLRSLDTADAIDAAKNHFLRALNLAHQQGAMSWELRAAISLGRLNHAQGRGHEARDLLTSVYARFTEGFETADLQTARRLLEEWKLVKVRDAKH